MNANSFLTCLNFTGINNTGTYVLGLYAFNSGDNNFIYNQLFTTGFNYFNNLPFAPALPLIYEGTGNQISGHFNSSQAYQISNIYNQDFGVLMFLNNSGCLRGGDNSYLLASTTSGLSGGNSGAILGLTPTNRLYMSVTGGFSQTAPTEIDIFDFVFFSIQKNRFVNFGSFNLKTNAFYRESYDYGSSGITINNLFIGGALNYPVNLTGYSGIIQEVYLFNGNITDSFITPCINCVFSTGYSYAQATGVFFQKQITGSYWSGIQASLLTGYQIVPQSYPKINGTTGTIYYNSGLTGVVNLYSGLFSQSTNIPYTGLSSGVSFLYNSAEIMSGLVSNLYFGVPVSSGDIVEVYTYPYVLNNIGIPLSFNSQLPFSNQTVQLYGNGLAETSGVDYQVSYGNYFQGFDNNDILLYDIIPSSITMPYYTGYILTGASGSYYTLITGISGVNMNQFNYDIYLNGQKMASGVNYTYTSSNLFVSGSDLADINDPSDTPEFKLIPEFPSLIRVLFEITGSGIFIGTITGYSEQVWLNGLRQSNGIDYFKTNTCSFCTGFYFDPEWSFNLYNSTTDAINLFNISIP